MFRCIQFSLGSPQQATRGTFTQVSRETYAARSDRISEAATSIDESQRIAGVDLSDTGDEASHVSRETYSGGPLTGKAFVHDGSAARTPLALRRPTEPDHYRWRLVRLRVCMFHVKHRLAVFRPRRAGYRTPTGGPLGYCRAPVPPATCSATLASPLVGLVVLSAVSSGHWYYQKLPTLPTPCFT